MGTLQNLDSLRINKSLILFILFSFFANHTIFAQSLKEVKWIKSPSPVYSELNNLFLFSNNSGIASGKQVLVLNNENWELMKSCRTKSQNTLKHEEDAVGVIIDALWEKLQQTHKLRVLKK